MNPSRRLALVVLAILLAIAMAPALAAAQAPAYLAQWGSHGTGDGQFYYARGVAVDASGNLYVADPGNSRIQVFTGSGTYLTRWGTFGSGDGQFDAPTGVAVDGSGHVYVVDRGNSRIQVFGPLPVPAKSTTWGRIKALYR